ncbi:DUF421 domain-containing protein [Bacillus benzoevorans]|uniref:Uncharacterized membrane protein YcaP (DUF421 family) n=1 Tax=Bacillus benzoevorans TaxID=1456 RepID=A0A7X0HNH0_9BACI|nr:YetF domain-containing protein [Bacillus benzoevorans]MBB6444015.1 uncharacterized membrane protein YcaP (DUF421 family) [Bacillus benzoevorans]
MDFVHGQEHLTSIQWAFRAVIAYFFLLIAAKMMGQRAISQLRLIDFIMALVLGNIIAHPLSDARSALKGAMITTTVLVVLYLLSVWLILRNQGLRSVVQGKPFPLIKNDQILVKNLAKARISIDFLLSELRKKQITDVQQVALALWEPDGSISLFLKPQHQTVTQTDIALPVKSFDLPRTIVKEGKLDFQALQELGKDESWVESKLKTEHNEEVHNILLATIDQADSVRVFLYH